MAKLCQRQIKRQICILAKFLTIKSSHHVWEKNIYMIMCWTTPKWPSFPSNPVILCCLLIIEKAGTHFHRIYEAIYIYSQEKEKKNNCPDHKKRANAYINFIHSYKTLHVYTPYTVKKKCDKMYFWRYFWDDVSVVLIWKNLKLWYDKPDYIIEKTKAMTRRLMWGVPGHVHNLHNLTSPNLIYLINDKIFHCVTFSHCTMGAKSF